MRTDFTENGSVQMASVGQVKRNLHDGFPWLYENLGRIYRMTPYGKYRKARRNAEIARTNDHLQKDLQKKIQIRFEYELRIVREHLIMTGRFGTAHSLE